MLHELLGIQVKLIGDDVREQIMYRHRFNRVLKNHKLLIHMQVLQIIMDIISEYEKGIIFSPEELNNIIEGKSILLTRQLWNLIPISDFIRDKIRKGQVLGNEIDEYLMKIAKIVIQNGNQS
jgi:hypothetical protein